MISPSRDPSLLQRPLLALPEALGVFATPQKDIKAQEKTHRNWQRPNVNHLFLKSFSHFRSDKGLNMLPTVTLRLMIKEDGLSAVARGAGNALGLCFVLTAFQGQISKEMLGSLV